MHALLGALAVINVRSGRVPAYQASLLIAPRTKADEKPSVLAVVAAPTLFVLERLAQSHCFSAPVMKPGLVFGMAEV